MATCETGGPSPQAFGFPGSMGGCRRHRAGGNLCAGEILSVATPPKTAGDGDILSVATPPKTAVPAGAPSGFFGSFEGCRMRGDATSGGTAPETAG